MKILVKSVEEAFAYVMDHYAPPGLEEMADRTDTYAVISIQDTHLGGFGFEFKENRYCKGVLTLYFDDIVKPVEGATLFSKEQASQILDFTKNVNDKVDTLLIHCYAGSSRSLAVGKALTERFGWESEDLAAQTVPNEFVYQTMKSIL